GGNVAASYTLGFCEKQGKGTPHDIEAAIAHLSFAADAGHPHACYCLAECYEKGEGVAARDKDTALMLYKKAAAKGHAGALKKIAELERQSS
ncbi:MAG: sel1 repeat family protein, partial [Clostridia bacterium]|nr:sel1 repeat family protein [Clostridia bacterium]